VSLIHRSATTTLRSHNGNWRLLPKSILVPAFLIPTLFAQLQTQPIDVQATAASNSSPSSGAPLTITLQDALQRAKANEPQFRSAATAMRLAGEDRVQARAALLPSVTYNNSFVYTQGAGRLPSACAIPGSTCTPVRFIANNAVHEYLSQADVHQAVSLTGFADYSRSSAMLAEARAKAEIATRGLVVTVTQAYYGLIVAQRKYASAQRAASEAQRFLSVSQKLENGGEVAHADVLKASIQSQQQDRALQEAQLDMERTRLELAVLLFPDFNQDFAVVDDLQTPEAIPTFSDVEVLAKKNNPELRAALAALQAARYEVTAAWGGLLPSLTMDYFYGIDANQFSVKDRNGVRNLGYSAVATLQIPIFSWGSDRSKLKQAELRRDQSRVELSFAQRQLLAHLRQFYNEAEIARSEMQSLASSAEMAADSLRLTTLRYQAGESTVLEVVDAQNTLTLARNAYDDGQARFRVAVANLQTLTGNF
jgi:outer membrane protein